MAGDKKADTWMPLWIGAYLADTMKLTTLQHGAYLLLLIAYWRERKALADDDEELRAITKLERSEWKRVRPVLAKFFRVGDGVWWHKRVEAEIAEADERAKKAAEKAGRAAQARWKKPQEHSTSNAPSMPQALQEHMHEECPPPSPIPLTTFADSVPGGTECKPRKGDALGEAFLVAQGVPAQAAKDWLKVRKSHRAPLTESAWEGIVSEASKAGITPAEAVQVCARKDWRGFNHAWDWRSAGVVGGAISTAKARNRQEERRNTMAALGGEFVTGASHATGDYIDV